MGHKRLVTQIGGTRATEESATAQEYHRVDRTWHGYLGCVMVSVDCGVIL